MTSWWSQSSRRFLAHWSVSQSSLELTEYTAVWRLLLRSLVASGSPPVFYLLLSVACREAEHLLEAELQQAVVAAWRHSPLVSRTSYRSTV